MDFPTSETIAHFVAFIAAATDDFIESRELDEEEAEALRAVVDAVFEPAFDAVEEAADDGIDGEEAIELISTALDAAIPLNLLLPGVMGELAEQADGPAIAGGLTALVEFFKRDPDKMRERAAEAAEKGKDKKAARLLVRADKVEERQAGQ